MLRAPVPYVSTFWAIVPMSGLRATTTGSNPGFMADPQPCQRAASGVAGAVMSGEVPGNAPRLVTSRLAVCWAARGLMPTISRSAPAPLSIALDTSSDFGNPDP